MLSIICIALLHISTWALLACFASFPREPIIFFPFSFLFCHSPLASGRLGVTNGSTLALISSSLESVKLTKRFAAREICLIFLTRDLHVSLSSESYFALWSPTCFWWSWGRRRDFCTFWLTILWMCFSVAVTMFKQKTTNCSINSTKFMLNVLDFKTAA